MTSDNDVRWMTRALELARHAEAAESEVPVGAVLVADGKLIGEGLESQHRRVRSDCARGNAGHARCGPQARQLSIPGR